MPARELCLSLFKTVSTLPGSSRTGDVVAKALLALLAFAVVASATIAVVSARKKAVDARGDDEGMIRG